tara:strand:- start:63 stop:689 length:627 start_codon:yes stop_codon:yes gene_type:complete
MSFGLVKHNNNSISAVTSVGLTQGKMTLIKEQTASSSSSISFVDGSSSVVFDNTYPIYLFKFINIHTSQDNTQLQFNCSSDSGSNYNVTKTTTHFYAYHNEGGSDQALTYAGGSDLAQSTSAQPLGIGLGTDNDQSLSGELMFFDPSNTVFVKHFLARTNNIMYHNYSLDSYSAGYMNTSSAVDAVQFSMNSGNIDSGTIKLYGIKGS